MKIIDSNGRVGVLETFGAASAGSALSSGATAILSPNPAKPALQYGASSAICAQVSCDLGPNTLNFDTSGGVWKWRSILDNDSSIRMLLNADGLFAPPIISSLFPVGLGAQNVIAGRFNLLYRATQRAGYTVTTAGSLPFSTPFIDACFDGEVSCSQQVNGNVSAAAVKPTISVMWTNPIHTQSGGIGVGWASRFWYPVNFTIEAYLSSDNDTYSWTTLFSETNWNKAYYFRLDTREAYVRGFRITVNSTPTIDGLQIGELFMTLREGSTPYQELYLDTKGGNVYGNLTVGGTLTVPGLVSCGSIAASGSISTSGSMTAGGVVTSTGICSTGPVTGANINATNGYQVGGAAPSGQYLRGNSSGLFVPSPLLASDLSGAGPGLLPVGSIVAWLESFPGTPSLPAGWQRCNGAPFADNTYYTGNTPNLNGTPKFLRGSTASGNVGGNDDHSHGVSTYGISISSIAGQQPVLTNIANAGNTLSASTLPAYYSVVWIMRIK